MARSMNRITLLGNLGGDPEVRYTASGTAVANMSLATNESYKDAKGELVENTQWHRLTAWGRLAEVMGEYCKKGQKIVVEGRMEYGQYENKDGVTVPTANVVVREFYFAGGSDGAFEAAPSESEDGFPDGTKNTNPEDDLPF